MPTDELPNSFGFDERDSWLRHARYALAPAPSLGRLGPFELLQVLGRGGQSMVYKAVQPGTGRIVALKCISGAFMGDEATPASFRREIEAVTRLHHPHIVAVFDAQVIDGRPVLVMEYVEGESLDRWADRVLAAGEGLGRVLEVITQVGDAVTHAHQRGVIHRDIKPSNVIVTPGGSARVLDFGIARLTEGGEQTLTSSFSGTPAYASPEQIEGGSAATDTRSDVYSLGLLMSRVLCGRAPYQERGGLPGMLEQIRSASAPRPSSVRTWLPRELDWIVLKAMDAEPQRRYQAASELVQDIRRLMAGEAVQAHPPSALYRAFKLVRRHRTIAGAGAAALLALVVGGIFAAYWAVEADAARKQAEQAKLQAQASASEAQKSARIQAEVTRLMVELFRTANPTETEGRADITVREALDQASTDLLSGASKYEPEVEATLRKSIAEVYLGLGLSAAAEVHLNKALELWRSTRDETSPPVIDTLHYLGRIYRESGRLRDATRIQTEVVRVRRLTLDAKSPHLAQALNSLAMALRRQERYREAEAAFREALAIYVKVLGEGDSSSISTGINLAILCSMRGQHEEALALAERSLKAVRTLHAGRGHMDLTNIILNSSMIHAAADRPEQAEALFQEGILLIDATIPNPRAAEAHWHRVYSEQYERLGQWALAETHIRSAIAAASKIEPPAQASLADLERRLAGVYRKSGRIVEALALCRGALARPGCDRVAMARAEFGSCLAAAGDLGQARTELLAAWDVLETGGETLPSQRRDVAERLAAVCGAMAAREPGRSHEQEAQKWNAAAVESAAALR